MRKWDIINVVEPDFEITQSRNNRGAIQSLVTSAVTAVFVIGVAVASSAQFTVKQTQHVTVPTAHVRFIESERFVQAPTNARSRISSDADTQAGQSTSRLAQLFQTYFVQAPAEEVYDDEYSFS